MMFKLFNKMRKSIVYFALKVCFMNLPFAFFWRLSSLLSSQLISPISLSRTISNINLIAPNSSPKIYQFFKNILSALLINRHLSLYHGNNEKTIKNYTDRIFANSLISDSDNLKVSLTNSPCILGLIHSGDYFVSVMQVAKLLEGKNIKLIILIGDEIAPLAQAIENLKLVLDIQIECVFVSRSGLLSIFRRARDPQYRILFFCDLSPQNGSTRYDNSYPCVLFGKNARLVSGVFQISAKIQLPFILMAGSISKNGFQLNLLGSVKPSYTFNSLFSKIVQLIELFVSKNPAQWLFTPVLETYFHLPAHLMDEAISDQRRKMKALYLKFIEVKS